MKYEEIQEKLVDFLDQSLPEQEMKEIQEHIDQNAELAHEVEEMKKLFFDMTEEEMEEPSPSLRMNFEEMLATEKAKTTKVISLQERTSWKPYIRVAASILIVVSAFLIGRISLQKKENINPEVANILTKLNSHSASQRIAALNSSETLETENTKIIDALIDRLLNDEKPSVRLAAVEALSKFSSLEMVKKAFLTSLRTDKDPAIQIELIQVLAKIQEKRALSPMKKLLDNENVPEYVKKEIQINIPSVS